MKKMLIFMVAMFGAAACGTKGPVTDTITTLNGEELKITFLGHASLIFEWQGKNVYVDPVTAQADFSTLPKADIIIVSHEHEDHFDRTAIETLSSPTTIMIANKAVIDALGYGDAIPYGQSWVVLRGMSLEAIPAYNTSPEKLQFHPKDRNDNGYLFNFGGTRVYVAGDTEQTPEMCKLRNIDVAFLPVNLPYTMTEEQVAKIVKELRPAIFYPYHTGGTGHKTNLRKLCKLLEGTRTEIRVRDME